MNLTANPNTNEQNFTTPVLKNTTESPKISGTSSKTVKSKYNFTNVELSTLSSPKSELNISTKINGGYETKTIELKLTRQYEKNITSQQSTLNGTTKSVLNSEKITKDSSTSLKNVTTLKDKVFSTPSVILNGTIIRELMNANESGPTVKEKTTLKKLSFNSKYETTKSSFQTTPETINRTTRIKNNTNSVKMNETTENTPSETAGKLKTNKLIIGTITQATEYLTSSDIVRKTVTHLNVTTDIIMNNHLTTRGQSVKFNKLTVCKDLDCGDGGECVLKSNKEICECHWGRKGILCEVNLRPLITCVIVLASIFAIVLILLVINIIRQRRFAKWKIAKFRSAKRDVYTTMPGSHKLINAPCRTSKRKSDAAYANLYEY